MYRLLVTGLKGQIGQAIKDRIEHQGWDVLFTDIDTLDITNDEQVAAVFKAFKPDVVINAAGYTDVDRAEHDVAAAEYVNAYGPYLLAIQCHKLGSLLIHFSTEYIFNGRNHSTYVETDTPAPLNVYGRTKLQGEQYIKACLSHYIIIRTSWVFSEYGRNFVTTMLSLSRKDAPIRIVNDQFGCPTYAGDLANLVVDITKDHQAETGRYQFGDYNFCGDSGCGNSSGDSGVSWLDFAYAIFDELDKYQPGEQGRNLTGVTTEEYASIAIRPKNGILNCHKISPIFRPLDWRRKLRHVIAITMA
ncbi:dTDP-4-dehydrorhamnose reductase [Moritella sp. Urea-trap-13]|uniref:dTDP-4-dehydrorhamnose reductase n=1 Tax=Moritella sp. Urea-trap-13 TaxID=2058327 RepID=UPI000C34482A|nr:dTDP-4-dehydrorhamnose reductase [Moritella sp. Urea-trap-13]PKH05988.1 dTDP-4-dehydrorhamnose reductase [Moritella sp. Urea-trap-13]